MTNRPSRSVRVAGLILTGVGAAHFLRPDPFESLLRPVFPRNTRWHMYVNGVKATLVGLGMVLPRTQRVAVLAAVGYVISLARGARRNGRVELDDAWYGTDQLDEEGLVEVYPIEDYASGAEAASPAPDATTSRQRESLR